MQSALRDLGAGDMAGVILAGRWRMRDLSDLATTVRGLTAQGTEVLLFGPVPEYDAPLALEPARIDRALAELAAELGVPYASPIHALCTGSGCLTYAVPRRVRLQRDYGHLTAEGSLALIRALDEEGDLGFLSPPPGARRRRSGW